MKLMNTVVAAGTAALLGIAGSAAAQGKEHGHGAEGGMMQGMDHGGMTSGGQAQSHGEHDAHGAEAPAATGSPSTKAYRAANLSMHEAMNFEFTDNADIDFARGMIGHHRGAIDMARIVLEHGEDPELRTLAGEVIEAQEAEIAFLQNWIAENAE